MIILVNGPYWISYDNEDSVALKTQYANKLGLAGMFGWSLETDDFEGRHSDVHYPILRVNSTSLILINFFCQNLITKQKCISHSYNIFIFHL